MPNCVCVLGRGFSQKSEMCVLSADVLIECVFGNPFIYNFPR